MDRHDRRQRHLAPAMVMTADAGPKAASAHLLLRPDLPAPRRRPARHIDRQGGDNHVEVVVK